MGTQGMACRVNCSRARKLIVNGFYGYQYPIYIHIHMCMYIRGSGVGV